MAKFILIDHSIVDIGGHYFEYAVHVLEAAEKAGYTSILATNCRFKADGRVPWEVHPVYKYGFWFRLAAPSWYRWIQQASSAVKGKMLRLKIWLIFSPLGFFWSIRNQFGEYLRRQPLSARLKVTFFLFLGLGYGFNLACSLRNLLWEVLPF